MRGELQLSSERQARMPWLDSKQRKDSEAQMAGQRSSGQAKMGEDLGNPGWLFDSSDDLKGATTVGPMFYSDIELAFRIGL